MTKIGPVIREFVIKRRIFCSEHKMLMLHNLLLKWSIEEIHLSYKIIHKISS